MVPASRKLYAGKFGWIPVVSEGGTDTFFHNIGCELVPTCTRSYIMGRELIPPCVIISWNNFMENAMVQSECYHILEQFDETICLFKLMENAIVHGAELSIPAPQAFLG